MKTNENILGYEKIGKLMKKFSIPCIISLVVNSLYNIVDQIFIGWGVGYLGNGATNIVFPLTMVCLSFALMFGDGASAYLSLKLGQKNKEDAKRGVANGVFISILVSILFCVFSFIFLNQILNLFGCTDALENYAMDYGKIIVIGLPFMMVGTTLNSIIRADGSPSYAMKSMVLGAILNIILDPIFIFCFHMGVEGAALATVFSQILTFLMNIIYIKNFQSVKLEKRDFHLDFSKIKSVSLLGISSFITQISIVLVIAFENNLLSKYGLSSKYGSEIPITVLGIVMKISQILNSIIIGIAAGSQPIIGFNYGASKYDRVRKTLKIVLISNVIVGLISFILFQTIPDKLIAIFGNGDQKYIEFACYAFRVYLMLCIFSGIQISAGIFFQAIGKSIKSALISLSRQILFLIPAMLILGHIYGVSGILYAGPTADLLAFIIASIFLTKEVRKLGKENFILEENKDSTNFKSSKKSFILTISREYGSGGRYIAKLLSESLKIPLYDKEFVHELSVKTGYSKDYILKEEQKISTLDHFNHGYYSSLTNADQLFIEESKLILELAKNAPCILVGRCADYILRDHKNVIKIFIYSDMDSKIKRAVKYYGLSKKKAEKEIRRVNQLRRKHYQYYTEKVWDQPSNYDLCLNSDQLGVEGCALLIKQLLEKYKN